MHKVIVLLGLFVAASPALAAPPPLPYKLPPDPVSATTPAQDEQIAHGKIAVGFKAQHPVYWLDVWGMVDAPPELVWRAITSYDKYQEFLPLVVDSGIRKRSPGRCWQYVRMQPPWPLHAHWMVNANVENHANWNLSWTMDDGNLRMEHGYWQIVPFGPDRCRLQYHLTVDPWLDVVPTWLVEFATKTVLPDVIKGVRKRVKHGK